MAQQARNVQNNRPVAGAGSPQVGSPSLCPAQPSAFNPIQNNISSSPLTGAGVPTGAMSMPMPFSGSGSMVGSIGQDTASMAMLMQQMPGNIGSMAMPTGSLGFSQPMSKQSFNTHQLRKPQQQQQQQQLEMQRQMSTQPQGQRGHVRKSAPIQAQFPPQIQAQIEAQKRAQAVLQSQNFSQSKTSSPNMSPLLGFAPVSPAPLPGQAGSLPTTEGLSWPGMSPPMNLMQHKQKQQKLQRKPPGSGAHGGVRTTAMNWPPKAVGNVSGDLKMWAPGNSDNNSPNLSPSGGYLGMHNMSWTNLGGTMGPSTSLGNMAIPSSYPMSSGPYPNPSMNGSTSSIASSRGDSVAFAQQNPLPGTSKQPVNRQGLQRSLQPQTSGGTQASIHNSMQWPTSGPLPIASSMSSQPTYPVLSSVNLNLADITKSGGIDQAKPGNVKSAAIQIDQALDVNDVLLQQLLKLYRQRGSLKDKDAIEQWEKTVQALYKRLTSRLVYLAKLGGLQEVS